VPANKLVLALNNLAINETKVDISRGILVIGFGKKGFLWRLSEQFTITVPAHRPCFGFEKILLMRHWHKVRASPHISQPIRPRFAYRLSPETAAELSEPSGEFSAAGWEAVGSGRL
jgi:hypothetical protein